MSLLRVPMMFPGQGSQGVGMAVDLAAAEGPAREFLVQVNDALGMDLLSIMFEGPGEVLTETRNAQPAILAHSVAMLLALRDRGIEPNLVAGHSLGEFSAAVACGALDPLDALRIVRRRGELMFAAGTARPGTMAAVMGLEASVVAEVCRNTAGVVVLANHNSPNQVVISGEIPAVKAAEKGMVAAGARHVIPLNVSGAFHSPLLDQAAVEFEAYLAEISFADPVVPLVANVSAQTVTTAGELRGGLVRQLTSPVLWHASLGLLAAEAGEGGLVLEVGPGKVLANLAKRACRGVEFLNVGTLEDLDRVSTRVREAGDQA